MGEGVGERGGSPRRRLGTAGLPGASLCASDVGMGNAKGPSRVGGYWEPEVPKERAAQRATFDSKSGSIRTRLARHELSGSYALSEALRVEGPP